MHVNPFPDGIFYSSKPKEFADNNFEYNENGRKFSKQVENTVEMEKLLVMSVFKRLIPQTHKNQGLFGKELIIVCKCFEYLDQFEIL